jgi:hypothetical protein
MCPSNKCAIDSTNYLNCPSAVHTSILPHISRRSRDPPDLRRLVQYCNVCLLCIACTRSVVRAVLGGFFVTVFGGKATLRLRPCAARSGDRKLTLQRNRVHEFRLLSLVLWTVVSLVLPVDELFNLALHCLAVFAGFFWVLLPHCNREVSAAAVCRSESARRPRCCEPPYLQHRPSSLSSCYEIAKQRASCGQILQYYLLFSVRCCCAPLRRQQSRWRLPSRVVCQHGCRGAAPLQA